MKTFENMLKKAVVTLALACGCVGLAQADVTLSDNFTSETDGYHIKNVAGLKEFRNQANTGVLNGENSSTGHTKVFLDVDVDLANEEWTPIYMSCVNFDGQNHTIKNLKVTTETKNVGLFGEASISTVKNLTIDTASVVGINHVAAVSGDGLCASFENCHVRNATIVATYSGNATDGYDDADKAAAICGYLSAENGAGIVNCSAEDCVISGYRDVGALAGYVNSYNTKTVLLTGNTVANVKLINNQAHNYNNYANNDPDSTSAFDVHELFGDEHATTDKDKTGSVAENVTISTGLVILNLDDLTAFRDTVNAGTTYAGQLVYLAADIDMSSVDNWTPIGGASATFAGYFDGGNHTISNLKVDTGTAGYAGFFGHTHQASGKATIKDLTLDNPVIKGGSDADYAGAIVAHTSAGYISNCKVIGGSMTGGEQVGGIVGYLGCGYVKNCTVQGTSIGGKQRVGGVVGKTNVDSEYSVVGNTVSGSAISASEYYNKDLKFGGAAGVVGQFMTNLKVGKYWWITDNSIVNVTTTTGSDSTLVPISTLRDSNQPTDLIATHMVRNSWYPTTDPNTTTVWTDITIANAITAETAPVVTVDTEDSSAKTAYVITDTSTYSVDSAATKSVITDTAVATKVETTTTVSGVELTKTEKTATVSGSTEKVTGIQAVVDAAKAKAGETSEFTTIAKAASDVNIQVDVVVTPTAYVAPVAAAEGVEKVDGQLAFKLEPKATVTVYKTTTTEGVTTTEAKTQVVEVTNDMIDQNHPISVNLYTGFQPKTITHNADDGTFLEAFGGSDIAYDKDTGIATVKISHFSSLVATQASKNFYQDETNTALWHVVNAAGLKEFADAVNGGTDCAGNTIQLDADITLSDEWTPIGSNNHPFSGVFDGQGHTISGLKITAAVTGSQMGLFGLVSGTHNDSYTSKDSVWINEEFDETNIAEEKYTAVVKNIVLADVSLVNESTSSGNRYTGALAGQAMNAYLKNITVSGSVTGEKGVGGVVGSLDSSIAKGCVNSATVVASTYNAGGIAGGSNYASSGSGFCSAFVDCSNSGAITTTKESGYAGGIVGMAQNDEYTVIKGCSNSGTIHAVNADAIGGIVGQGINTTLIVDCSNSGTLTADNNIGRVGGISGSSISTNYRCSNTADITVSADYLAGIFNYASGQGGKGGCVDCTNSGALTNTKTGGQVYPIGGSTTSAVFTNRTFDDVAEVNALIATLTGNTEVRFENCTVTDKTGTLTLLSNIQYITSDNALCTTVDVASGNASSLVIDIPDADESIAADYTGLLKILGANNDVTVASGVTVAQLTIQGNGSTLDNDGTITALTLTGDSDVSISATNDGTVGKLGFGGTGTYYFKNNGTVSHQQSATSDVCNQHTCSTITACNITIDNYGTIAATANANGASSYVLLFYNGATVVINCYKDSTISSVKYTLACGSANSVTYNVEDGATFTNGGTAYTPTSSGKLTVNKLVAKVYVAQIGTTKYETLAEAIAAVKSGETLTLLADVTDTTIRLPAGVTLDGNGNKVSGNSCVYVNAAGGAVKNVNFEDNHNSSSTLSPVYGSGLTGTMTVTDCTFTNWDWDAIQITPAAATANITITGNTFTAEAGENVHRGVHIQSSPTKMAFSANVTGNKFYGVDNLSETYLEVYDFSDASKVTVNGNYLDGTAKACILMNNYGTNVSDMILPLKNEGLTADIATVAKIKTSAYNYSYYPTLSAAVEAATAGQTITLLSDVALDATQAISKSLTLDLNGHNITSTDCRAIWQQEGTLTVTGTGTISATHTAGNTSFASSSSVIRVGDNSGTAAGLVLGKDATVSTDYCYGITYFGKDTQTVTINGTVAVTGSQSALSGNGTSGFGEVTLTVNGTVSSDNEYAIYNPQKGTTTINGTVTGKGGIEMKAGNLVVNSGATITATAETTSHTENNDGTSTSGYAIVAVNNNNYAGQTTVQVTGGTVTGKIDIITDNETTVNASIAVSGGTFSQAVAEEYCKSGYIPKANSDGTYGVKEGSYVAQVGTTKYETLAAALIAATSGDTIEILDGTWDADAVGTLDPAGTYTNANTVRYKSLTIQPAEGASPTFTSEVKLGYDDSSTCHASMTVKGLKFDGASLALSNYLTVDVENCTFVNGTTSTSGTLIVQDACCKHSSYDTDKTDLDYAAGGITIKNCSINGSNDGASGIRIRNSGNVTIENNTIANSKFNGILFESGADKDTGKISTVVNNFAKTITITGNTITEWNSGNKTEGGRAMRLSLAAGSDYTTLYAGSSVRITGNYMTKATTGLDSPDYVKITGAGGTVDLDGNCWNWNVLDDVNGKTAVYTVNGSATTINSVIAAEVSISDGTTTTKDTLLGLAQKVNAGTSYEGKTVTLLTDVDLTGVSWTPIGSYASSPKTVFSGTFDGNGKTISNLSVNGVKYGAMFANTSGATVKNLKLNVNNNGGTTYGCGLIGVAAGTTTIEDVEVSGSVVGAGNNGAFVGRNDATLNMKRCVNKASVTGTAGYTGGFIGMAKSDITMVNCQNEGAVSITVATSSVGGFAGYCSGNSLTIINCQNSGSITSTGSNQSAVAGGFIGGQSGYAGTITIKTDLENYEGSVTKNTGTITGEKAGGIVGSTWNTVVVDGAVNEGAVSGAFAGGIVGLTNTGVELSNCRNTGVVTANKKITTTTVNKDVTSSVTWSAAGGVLGCASGGATVTLVNCAGGTAAITATTGADRCKVGRLVGISNMSPLFDTGHTKGLHLTLDGNNGDDNTIGMLGLLMDNAGAGTLGYATIEGGQLVGDVANDANGYNMTSGAGWRFIYFKAGTSWSRNGSVATMEKDIPYVTLPNGAGWKRFELGIGDDWKTHIYLEGVGSGQEVSVSQNYTWTSSDTNIATVDALGYATGVAEGYVTLTATKDDYTYSVNMYVVPYVAKIVNTATTGYATFDDAVAAVQDDETITVINYTSTMVAPSGWKFVTDTTTGVTTLVRCSYVAQIGETKYETLAAALIAATSGDTIEILDGTWDADAVGTLDPAGTYTNANTVRYKSLTIQPAEGASPTFTSEVKLGYDDSSTCHASMTVKGLKFNGASLVLSNYLTIDVENCTFVNGTSNTDGVLIVKDACCKHKTNDPDTSDLDYTKGGITIKNCSIDGSNDGASGIRLRDSGNVTIEGCSITNSKFNGILFESNDSVVNTTAKTISITGNTIDNWNSADTAGKGRAMRLALGTLASGSSVTITGNYMTKTFPEGTKTLDSPDFMKITGCGSASVDLSGNAWNYDSFSAVSAKGNYYSCDATTTTLTSVIAYVAQIGTTKYATLQAAVNAAVSNDTITMIDNENVKTTVVVSNKKVTIDLNEKTLSNTADLWDTSEGNWSMISVRAYGDVTITGNGTIDCKKDDEYALDVCYGGKLTIKNGSFTGNISAVYVYEGECAIEGGVFDIKQMSSSGGYNFLINCLDANYTTETATVSISGGSFVGYNPQHSMSEPNGPVNFCAAGYATKADTINNKSGYTVVAAVASITSGETTTYYATLADATAAVKDGETITVINYSETMVAPDGWKFVTKDGVTTLVKCTYVAQIGTTKYETLAQAIAAVQDDQTITMLVSVEPGSDGALYWLTINNDKTFTLDLNEKTLSAYWLAMLKANMTLTNGKFLGSVYQYTTDEDGAYNSFTLASGATIDAREGYGIVVYQNSVGAVNYGSTVTINGTIENTCAGVWVMGNIHTDLTTAQHPVTINFNGVITATTESTAFCLAGSAVANITGGTITGGTAIEVRAGSLNVTDGTITATAKPTTITANGNGATTDGAALAIAQHTTKLPIVVNITGGTFTGYSAVYESNPQNNSADDIAKVTMSVLGGKFATNNSGTVVVYSADKTGFISGGVYSVLASADYLASGKSFVANTDTTTKTSYPYMVSTAETIDVGGTQQPLNSTAAEKLREADEAAKTAGNTVVYQLVDQATEEITTIPRTQNFADLNTGKYTMQTVINSGSPTEIINVGVIKVQPPSTATSTTTTKTILAVPWKALNGTPVTVANFFSCNSENVNKIASGDTLSVYVPSKGKYVSFAYENGKWTDAGDGLDPTTTQLTRGTGAIFTHTGSDTIALVGLNENEGEVSTTVDDKTVGIAVNVTTSAKTVKSMTVKDSNGNDLSGTVRVFVPGESGNLQYTKSGSSWVKPVVEEKVVNGRTIHIAKDQALTEDETIPAGTGVWIQNASGETAVIK